DRVPLNTKKKKKKKVSAAYNKGLLAGSANRSLSYCGYDGRFAITFAVANLLAYCWTFLQFAETKVSLRWASET
ncbi:hypothetical protein X777_07085, partial [Ooceraea biroi]